MNTSKYIGMDVHMATTVIAVVNSVGGIVAEAVVETKASTILDFLKSQRGTVHVTFEEGTQAAWLHDLIRPHIAEVVVCNPREIPVQDNKADKSDAKRLAELLRTHGLKAVYHGEHGTQALKELSRSYGAILGDSTRVKNRLKGVFRGRGISCTGTKVYSKKGREQWLRKLDNSAVRSRISKLFKELDFLTDRDQDTGDAGWIGLQTTQLQGGIRGCARETSFCDRFYRSNGRFTWSSRAENGGVTTLDDGRTRTRIMKDLA